VSDEACQRCGEPLPDRARFCPNCGAPVVSEARERKLVTVLFADLTASTQLARRLDPERFREVLAAFYQLVTDETQALRGRTEQYIGDAVMGVFGVPTAHDDDAVRAIRAGLSIVERSERLGEQLGLPTPMSVRVGVNTGSVAVGSGSGPALVSGADVNLAARMQQAAEPGEVLVGETTHQLAMGQVEFGDPRSVDAKGFAGGIHGWPALRLDPRGVRKSIPIVDRRRELTLLQGTFERVAERERAHLVTLLGEPGIGKTRVVEEFLAGLPGDTKVLLGRSSAFEEVAFSPIAQMVLREIGEERDAPADRIRGRLLEAVRALVAADEVEHAAHRLGLAVGLGEEGREENRYHAGEVRAGLLALLAGLSARGPVVLVFEDLHEADPLLLDLIEQLVKAARRMPLLVVCVARWEFLGGRPGWAGGIADAVTLWVEPLAKADAIQLAMAAGELDEEQAVRVAEHAGGNPLFIIEITGMLRHEGRDVPPRAAAASGRLLPPTVQAVIAARMDDLSTAARELLRRASIFARGVFDVSELSLVAEPKKELLEELEDDEFLVRDDERPSLWRFRSDVLRDVAYESLAKRERQRLHLRLATKLGEPATAVRYPRAIAYHLEQAARAALDLNPRDRALAERAVEALAKAGDLARRRVESRAAVDLYERALALAGHDDGWGEREAWILSMLGEARYWLGEFDDAESAFRRALEIAASSARVRAHACRFLADIALTIRGMPQEAAELFERALGAARELDRPPVLARTLLMAAWEPFSRNDMREARAMFEEALEVTRSAERRDAWAEARALVGLSAVVSRSGSEAEALELGLEALAIGEASGQAFTTAVAEQMVGASLRRMLRLDEALVHAQSSVRILRELGARWELAAALGDLAEIHRVAGNLEDAEREFRETYLLCREVKDRTLVTWTAAQLARTLVARGDIAAAQKFLDEPAARVSTADPSSRVAMLLAEATVAWAEGDKELALERSRESIAVEDGLPESNLVAGQIWWTARLFDEDAAGGAEAVDEARRRLESHQWSQAMEEPDLLLRGAVPRP
jgi:class 3 adenylate cyclase/tetratricopeptide (TPR) repeat protein